MSEQRALSDLLLPWYDQHKRALLWRENTDPYRVWLAEIMLQQTTVVTATPYYAKFLQKWPQLKDLAGASLDDVLTAWAGLGYYTRARNLHACAQKIMAELNGKFPGTEKELQALPGIGPYTAAAIASISFDKKANVVDGNVERVMARVHAVQAPLPAAKAELKELAATHVPATRNGDYAQALMDLGATVCTPRSPSCDVCPLGSVCLARREEKPENYPRRASKRERPSRTTTAYALFDENGRLFLRKRPEKGLLAHMLEVPSTDWQNPQGPVPFNLKVKWLTLDEPVLHVFTHFSLRCTVNVGHLSSKDKKPEGIWVFPQEALEMALPSVMKKIVEAAESFCKNAVSKCSSAKKAK